MTNHKISHLYQPEIIVPYGAIENNWEVREGDICEMNDGVNATIENVQHLNMLSPDSESTVMRIYKISSWGLLKQWYLRGMPLNSIYFLKLTLRKNA
jgi:hypothetical protein